MKMTQEAQNEQKKCVAILENRKSNIKQAYSFSNLFKKKKKAAAVGSGLLKELTMAFVLLNINQVRKP